MPQIALVCMPFAATERPSIALGILQAAAEGRGLECRSYYANLWYAEEVGLATAKRISSERFEALVGEWVFAAAAFPDHQPEPADYFKLVPRGDDQAFVERVQKLRAGADDFVERTARRVLAERPRIVGCSSMFHQQCASLALLRRIKELDPSVVTMLGGANCEGTMGRAVREPFPWVDYVVSGEADLVFPELCRQILEGVPSIDLPGVFGPGAPPSVERLVLAKVDDSPCPNYDDYFAQLETSAVRTQIRPGLLIETSRGCWWGQKHHCTFCGLNGTGMNYRSKSPERVLADFHTLSERYGTRNFEVVDNIIDLTHIRTVLPTLAREGGYNLFYETKANLKHEQLEVLNAAGVRWLQPGIESLHDGVLKLMDKGTTSLINVQLLKWAREFGMYLSWNFLLGLPGEEEHWYAEMMEWLPLIWHLQPPTGCPIVRYDRFSPYFYRPQDYGLELLPCQTYACIYPQPPERLADLAYFFEDGALLVRRREDIRRRPVLAGFIDFLKSWREAFLGDCPPVLCMADDGEAVTLIDTRPCAVATRHELTGARRETYLACNAARPVAGLDPDCLEDLRQRKLVLVHAGKALALGVSGELPFLPMFADYPGGHVREAALA